MVIHVHNPNPWEVEEGESEIQSHLAIVFIEFQASLWCMKLSQKKKKKSKKQPAQQFFLIENSWIQKVFFKAKGWK